MLRLTDQSIDFEMYLPFKRLEIALRNVSQVDVTDNHLGKLGFNLLRISYIKGQDEVTVAWSVSDVDEWIRQINKLRIVVH